MFGNAIRQPVINMTSTSQFSQAGNLFISRAGSGFFDGALGHDLRDRAFDDFDLGVVSDLDDGVMLP